MEISIEDFRKVELVVGKILEVNEVPNSNKLYKLTVDIGEKKITLLSGIKKYYKKEELLNKKIIVLKNIMPAKMAGLISEGMLLAAEDKNGNLSLLTVDRDIQEGAIVM